MPEEEAQVGDVAEVGDLLDVLRVAAQHHATQHHGLPTLDGNGRGERTDRGVRDLQRVGFLAGGVGGDHRDIPPFLDLLNLWLESQEYRLTVIADADLDVQRDAEFQFLGFPRVTGLRRGAATVAAAAGRVLLDVVPVEDRVALADMGCLVVQYGDPGGAQGAGRVILLQCLDHQVVGAATDDAAQGQVADRWILRAEGPQRRREVGDAQSRGVGHVHRRQRRGGVLDAHAELEQIGLRDGQEARFDEDLAGRLPQVLDELLDQAEVLARVAHHEQVAVLEDAVGGAFRAVGADGLDGVLKLGILGTRGGRRALAAFATGIGARFHLQRRDEALLEAVDVRLELRPLALGLLGLGHPDDIVAEVEGDAHVAGHIAEDLGQRRVADVDGERLLGFEGVVGDDVQPLDLGQRLDQFLDPGILHLEADLLGEQRLHRPRREGEGPGLAVDGHGTAVGAGQGKALVDFAEGALVGFPLALLQGDLVLGLADVGAQLVDFAAEKALVEQGFQACLGLVEVPVLEGGADVVQALAGGLEHLTVFVRLQRLEQLAVLAGRVRRRGRGRRRRVGAREQEYGQGRNQPEAPDLHQCRSPLAGQ